MEPSQDSPPTPTPVVTPELSHELDNYQPRLRAWVGFALDSRLRARIDPSDVVQDALTEAVERWPTFTARPGGSLLLWLRSITKHRVAQAHRTHLGRKRRDARRESRSSSGSTMLDPALAAPGASPSQLAMQNETRDRILTALRFLRPTEREIVWLRHFDGMGNSEAATALGISLTAASMRYTRALQELGRLL